MASGLSRPDAPWRGRRSGGTPEPGQISFTLAHLSDLHVTPIRGGSLWDFANKRALGRLSWLRKRRHEHRPEILGGLLADLDRQGPDHVALTGDLTNVGLRSEIEAALPWLRALGGPSRVSLVPGNHDAYAAPVEPRGFAPWNDYMGEPGIEIDASRYRFPYVRRAGPIALIGLSSAIPTPVGLASGRLGSEQLEDLEARLEALGREPCCRVVLIHHPPVGAGQAPRRRLTDAPALRAVLARQGAELILHGHIHRPSVERIEGPAGPIPVVGVASSSARGRKPGRRASYHLYRFDPAAGGRGFRIRLRRRVLEPSGDRFREDQELPL